MIICLCGRACDRDTARAVRSGGAGLEKLQRTPGVATGCHGCALPQAPRGAH